LNDLFPDTTSALAFLGILQRELGDFRAAAAALGLARQSIDPILPAVSSSFLEYALALTLANAGEHAAALDQAEQLEELAWLSGEHRLRSLALLLVGDILREGRAYREAEAAYRGAMEANQAAVDSHIEAAIKLGLGASLWVQCRFDEAYALISDGHDQLEQLGDLDTLIRAKGEFAKLAIEEGRLTAAMHMLKDMEELADAFGVGRFSAIVFHEMGIAYQRQGNLAEAAQCLTQAIAIAQDEGQEGLLALSKLQLAGNEFRDGHLAAAESLEAESEGTLVRLGDRLNLAHAWLLKAVFEATRGNIGSARSLLRAAIEESGKVGDEINVANCAQALRLLDQLNAREGVPVRIFLNL
jgi:tetratricopeptide (TPR) repeat protein